MAPPATAQAVGARLRAVQARGRTAEVLLGIALDVLEPYASEYLSPDDYNRLCGLVREPVTAATEAALMSLLAGLAPLVEEGDPALAARLDLVRHRGNVAAD